MKVNTSFFLIYFEVTKEKTKLKVAHNRLHKSFKILNTHTFQLKKL